MRKVYLNAIQDYYEPLHPIIYTFSTDMLSDKIKNWLFDQECDEEGVPTCVTKEAPGVYSFEFLKPEFNLMLMEEIGHFKEFLKENKLPNEAPNA